MLTFPVMGDTEKGVSFNLTFGNDHILLYVHIKEKESKMTILIKSTLFKTYGENLITHASSPT